MRGWVASSVLVIGCNNPPAPDAGKVAPSADASDDAAIADSGWDSGDAGIAEDSLPASSSTELTMRARHLLEAIAQDNPDLAADILFPREAWINLHDVPTAAQDPAKQWDEKVKGVFKTNVHYWNTHTKDIARAQFVSFEIGKTVQQITPKKKDWKKALWQVKHSQLTFSIDGQTKHIEIAEMVGWRGAWYVVHLR
jgi:hypothetical protein